MHFIVLTKILINGIMGFSCRVVLFLSDSVQAFRAFPQLHSFASESLGGPTVSPQTMPKAASLRSPSLSFRGVDALLSGRGMGTAGCCLSVSTCIPRHLPLSPVLFSRLSPQPTVLQMHHRHLCHSATGARTAAPLRLSPTSGFGTAGNCGQDSWGDLCKTRGLFLPKNSI